MNDALRDLYRESSRPRLQEMREALDAWPTEEARKKLKHHFHSFSGMGGTYGFPRVSELGDEGEELLRSPDAGAVARWRELVDEIERELC